MHDPQTDTHALRGWSRVSGISLAVDFLEVLDEQSQGFLTCHIPEGDVTGGDDGGFAGT